MKRLVTFALLLLLPFAALAEEGASPLAEENLLLMQPLLDDFAYEDSIPVYYSGQHYFLPLQALASLLELGIKVTEGKAEGWISEEKETFALDMKNHLVVIAGKESDFPAADVVQDAEDIYVEKTLLESWLPLSFAPSIRKLTLDITAHKLLPLQARNNRQKKWASLKKPQAGAVSYPLETLPYQAISWPFVDISTGYNYNNTPDTSEGQSNYSIRAGGDMGYLSTQIFAAGQTSNPVDTLRISAGRTDSEGALLGPLHATRFTLGDISSEDMLLVSPVGQGKGFAATNRPLNRSSQPNLTNFVGDATPGWDVELYRNGVLLNAAHIDDNGRYEFTGVPVLYGNNSFRLLFYGPQGQSYAETHEIMADSSVLHAGEMNYAFSVDAKSETLMPVGNQSTTSFTFTDNQGNEATSSEEKGLRSIAELEYGVTDTLTATMGVAHVPLLTDTRNYASTGLRTTLLPGILASQDFSYDATGQGWVEKTALLMGMRGVSLRADYSYYDHFINETQQREEKTYKNIAEAELNMPVPYFSAVNTGIVVSRQVFVEDETDTSISHRLSTSYRGVSMTHAIGRVETSASGIDTVTTQGQFGINGTVKETAIRAAGSYSLPDDGITTLSMTAQRRLREKLVMVNGLTKNLQNDDRLVASSSLNWDAGTAKYSVKLDVDDAHQSYLGVNVNTSLARKPSTGKWQASSEAAASGGGVEARAFLDKNNNGQFDGEDEWIPGSKFTVGTKKLSADKDKVAFRAGLPPDMPTIVTLDETSLEDPLWISTTTGYKVMSRPGMVTPLSFPVIASSEIDGTVSQPAGKGLKALPHVTLELVGKEGEVKQKTRTEFDGFYVFERVVPGDYTLRIAPVELEKRHMAAEEKSLHVSALGDVYSGYDMMVRELP